ncbi:MAG: hypothetical protein FJX59_20100 [Alphaproteobacteria bacterium]|nr:hypothetical protein [Alphaproteobacteria bacterium]
MLSAPAFIAALLLALARDIERHHHLILGGAVNGSEVYGKFPMPELGGPDDSGNRGTLIPSTSLDQYGATLAKWFGVDATRAGIVFPNLRNFQVKDLGFMA